MRYLHFGARLPLIFVAVFLSAQTTLYGQKLSIGIAGGAALTDLMGQVSGSSDAKRYTFGPILEIRLPASFAAEISALYRRTGFTGKTVVMLAPATYRVRANSWEFPLLVKYYLARPSVVARPYISGGYALRFLSDVQATFTTPEPFTSLPPYRSFDYEYRLQSNPSQGMAIGGGMSFKAGRIHIAPGARYTRWFTVPFDEYGPHAYTVQSARNQVDLLVAVTF